MSRQFEEGGLAVEDRVKPRIKPPRKYQVILLNDDFTPMDFVVEVLTHFFQMDEFKANQVMMAVHQEGKGVCGVYSKEIAEMKVHQVNQYARDFEHPLQCQMEVV
jgi:ATP-dependent Clp protease adaptor protein ClpS